MGFTGIGADLKSALRFLLPEALRISQHYTPHKQDLLDAGGNGTLLLTIAQAIFLSVSTRRSYPVLCGYLSRFFAR
jgi:hypothetical protein